MNDYFAKNSAIFSDEEMELLKLKKVFVAGCGGLGGSITEILARTGIGCLVLADMDVFEPSNMNRQILCTEETLGMGKAQAAASRVRSINPDAQTTVITEAISAENASALIKGCDIVIDALDSVEARLVLEDACSAEGLFLIHGAVNGWALQTGVCPPGAGVLHSLYGGKNTATHPGGGIAMTVFTCAAFEVSEAVNVLLGRPGSRDGKLLFFDLLTKESQIIPMP